MSYWEENKERLKAQNYANRAKKKLFLIALLGGVCAACAFSDSRALQFDHLNGGGKQEINASSSYDKYTAILYRMAQENPEAFKLRYQLLCANCNWIKRYERKEHG